MIAGLLAVFVGLTLLAIWDAFRREFKTSGEKMAWIQLCVLVPFLGGVAYLLLGKKRGRKTQ
ncbi:MAG: PLD nuclease N-terminal domain-containing protein [Desulfovibrionaceae bacterium]|nr:PLD nuclease N-terminal domain-containing protein [Desulfovibrionaceae bacterium]